MELLSLTSVYMTLLVQSIQVDVTEVCPPYYSILPCTCLEHKNKGITVSCRGLNRVESFENIFKVLKNRNFDTFILEDSSLPFLPSGLFNNSSLETLIIRKSYLASLKYNAACQESPFKGLEGFLQDIRIERTEGIENWLWSELHGMVALEKLDLSSNKIHILTRNLGNLTSIKWFTAAHSGIHLIEEGALSTMKELISVNLAHNQLRTIPRKVLPNPATSLRSIYLNNNRLEHLPEDIFRLMPSLKIVDVSRNSLRTMPEVVGKPGTLLNLQYNLLHCDCNMRWLIQNFECSKTLQGQTFCHGPERNKNRNLQDMTIEDLCKIEIAVT